MDLQGKIVTALAGGLAAWLGTKALGSAWKAVTGNTAPEDPQDPDRGMVEAVVFAGLSGALIGIVRTLATRGATKYVATRQIAANTAKAWQAEQH